MMPERCEPCPRMDMRKYDMSEKQPTIETNDENLDRPWAWLARIPCMAYGPDGEPYAGAAELRVILANHEQASCPEAFEHAPPIHIHGMHPFGPMQHPARDESMVPEQVGMFVLTITEARALAAGLLRAAEHHESDERIEYWDESPVLHAVVAAEGFADWQYLYSIHSTSDDAVAEIKRRENDPDAAGVDLIVVAVRITETGMRVWNSYEEHPWPHAVRKERTCPNCEWAESDCSCRDACDRYKRAKRMLERLLAGFEVAIAEPERSYEVFTSMHDGLVHFLAHENVEGLGEDYELTPEVYHQIAKWAARRANTVAKLDETTKDAPRKAKRDRILDGLRGQNEPATLEVGAWSDGQWKRTGERRGFWCQSDAVLVDARSPSEAIEKYRRMVADADVGISHNYHTDGIRALRAERGDVAGDGTRLPRGPAIATWRNPEVYCDTGPHLELLLYEPDVDAWCGDDGSTWSRAQLESRVAAGRLRVKPLPPALAEPMLPAPTSEEKP